MKQPPRLWLAGVAVALGLNGVGWVRAQTEEPATLRQSRGKQIYVRGTSPSGKDLLAYLGESSLKVPGDTMACANCHGLDGQGKPESGVNPSNLTWEALTKPYGVTHADGRQHPPYTKRGLELAITRGTDPAGNKLQNAMPRYRMSSEDLADLIVYLELLGKDRDPGISDNTIAIGMAAPAKGALADMGQAVKAVTTAFIDELNSQGGIYNRRLELKFVETAETPAATRANVERLLKDEKVFAMTGVFIAGADNEILALMARQEVPLIGPLTLYPQTGFPLNRQVFYLLSGMDGQARALVDFVAKRPELKSPATVVYPQSELNVSVLGAITDQSKKDGLSAPQAYDYAPGRLNVAETVKQLRQTGRDAVFFLGTGDEALSLMREADKLNWFPAIFLPGGSAGPGIFGAPIGFSGRVFCSFPIALVDQSADGIREFRSLADKYMLPTEHLAAQISAYSAAKILVEALKRVGKDLSREKLIQALEGLYEYRTGLTPAITYGPNRRIGAMGAYVVTIDLKEKQFSPASGWININ
jgi:ABC-type branched-subunit amino acid transport system substrate-binding protein